MASPTKPPFPDYIDSTMLATFKSCPQKFNYAFLRHLHGEAKSIHLIAGGAFAAGLEAARRFCFTPRELLSPELQALPPYEHGGMMLAAFSAFRREWGNFDLAFDAGKSFINTWYALETYLTDYHPMTDFIQPIIGPDKKPQVEFSFAIPLPINHPVSGSPLLYVGRFDMLGKWEDATCIVDEKTTTALGDQWRRQWNMRGQFLGYCWACQQLGIPVTMAVARGTAILKTKVNFMTVPVIYPQYLIDRWYENTLRTIQELVARWTVYDFPLVFADGCTAYGGCTYELLCSASDPEAWTNNFVVREWNPVSPGLE